MMTLGLGTDYNAHLTYVGGGGGAGRSTSPKLQKSIGAAALPASNHLLQLIQPIQLIPGSGAAKAIVTVDCSSISTPEAFCIGLATSPTTM